ncbi:hypothetical protein [Chromobacterium haemolyticum]|uniref:hypothetical protein n=1 Tax=Chromobacterium haemolyticum TaxID=394935 RepID=UPI0024489F91|nr:hypothetical protein [Chromobacterium haemolyticum]MDH0341999.1 hypothetical protein [Chromobacterium haemolyticum]
MIQQEAKLLTRAISAALIGAVVGIAISAWWLSPKHSPEELRIAEADLLAKMDREEMAENLSALKGPCKDGALKATPTGYIGECKGGRWTTGLPKLDKQLEMQAMAEQLSATAKP